MNRRLCTVIMQHNSGVNAACVNDSNIGNAVSYSQAQNLLTWDLIIMGNSLTNKYACLEFESDES